MNTVGSVANCLCSSV